MWRAVPRTGPCRPYTLLRLDENTILGQVPQHRRRLDLALGSEPRNHQPSLTPFAQQSSVRPPRSAHVRGSLAPPTPHRGLPRTTASRGEESQAYSRRCVACTTRHRCSDSKSYCFSTTTLPAAESWRGLGAESFKGAPPQCSTLTTQPPLVPRAAVPAAGCSWIPRTVRPQRSRSSPRHRACAGPASRWPG